MTTRPDSGPTSLSARRSRARLARAVTAAFVCAALSAAGCGASSASSDATHHPKHSNRNPDPAAQYAQCMRTHGVPNFPNPVDGHIQLSPASGIDPSSPQFKAASQACASLGPSGGTPAGTAPGDRATTTTTPVSEAQWTAFSEWLKQQAAQGQFSGTVLVARDGKQLLDAGYGIADRGTDVPNTPHTKFCIASIGKLFTAVAVAQLVEQHKLAFNDTIGHYLKGFAPAIADQVTVGELLTMTSGLGNVALGRPSPPSTLAANMELIVKESLQFKPGSRFLYSNDGYIALGAIIQSVTGQSYAGYVREHVFQPAGMTQTGVSVYTPARVPGMAHGYMLVGANGQPLGTSAPPAPGQSTTPQPSSLRDNSAMQQIANPSGGAYSTVGDLLKFAQALLDHKLLSPAMTDTVLVPRVNAPQPGGPPVDKYTYGFAYQAINGISFIGHSGGTPGYEGQIDIYPKTSYVVAILTNQDQVLIPAIQKSEAILTS